MNIKLKKIIVDMLRTRKEISVKELGLLLERSNIKRDVIKVITDINQDPKDFEIGGDDLLIPINIALVRIVSYNSESALAFANDYLEKLTELDGRREKEKSLLALIKY